MRIHAVRVKVDSGLNALRFSLILGLLLAILGCFFAGILVGPTQLSRTLLVVPATCGALLAGRLLKSLFIDRPVKLKPYPTGIEIDRESGEATLTMSDGSLFALHIPEEVLEGGPFATMNFIANEVLGNDLEQ